MRAASGIYKATARPFSTTHTEGKRIRAAREPEDLPKELETWNGIHAQITAPNGTFERIWNEAEEGGGRRNMNEYREMILRTVGKYIQTQHEENGLGMLGVNDQLFSVEVILQTLDAMIREEEAPKRITLGDVLDLIDPDREADDQIALMDCNGEAALMGPTKSKYWEPYEEKQVSGITAAGRALKVWLKEEEETE